jgi:putative ATP-binding cassette transporter
MGVISQASSAFGHILDDLSIVINSFTDVSKFSAGIDRLYSFLRAIQQLEPERSLESLLTTDPDDEMFGIKSEISTSSMDGVIRVKEYDPELTSHLLSQNSPMLGQETTPVIMSIKGLKLSTPDNKRLLVQNLDLSVAKGKNLLIVGASGSGKSSLLRAIAGLWSTGEGEIVRPSTDHVYFLPQKPYVSNTV